MVVPHGFEPELLIDITAEDELRERYALGDGPVLVYPAVTHPHKNHQFLLDLLATTLDRPRSAARADRRHRLGRGDVVSIAAADPRDPSARVGCQPPIATAC